MDEQPHETERDTAREEQLPEHETRPETDTPGEPEPAMPDEPTGEPAIEPDEAHKIPPVTRSG